MRRPPLGGIVHDARAFAFGARTNHARNVAPKGDALRRPYPPVANVVVVP